MLEGLIGEAQSHLLVSCTRATKPVSGSWGVICSMEGGGGATEASPQDHKIAWGVGGVSNEPR